MDWPDSSPHPFASPRELNLEIPATRSRLGAEVFRTRRLIMRQLVNADLSDLRRLDSDPRVTELLLDRPVRNLRDAWALVGYANTIYRAAPGLGIWHTRDRQNNFIGHFSLMKVDLTHDAENHLKSFRPPEPTRDVEIGVKLLPSAWGRAYAIEGGRALCDYAFGSLGLTHLVGLCHPENRVVPILLKRLGFVEHGVTVHFGKPAVRLRLGAGKWESRRLARHR